MNLDQSEKEENNNLEFSVNKVGIHKKLLKHVIYD
jgi:hypothetical protein